MDILKDYETRDSSELDVLTLETLNKSLKVKIKEYIFIPSLREACSSY